MATLQERLEEAKQALHDLALGKAMVEFRDSNGEVVRYNVANEPRLRRYIQELEAEIAGQACSGPMRPLFL